MQKIPKYNLLVRILDAIFHPIMWVLGGFTKDSLQRSHLWNIISYKEVLDPTLGIAVKGREEKVVKHNWGPFFHMPIFSGWKNYVVIEPEEKIEGEWHVGWHYKNKIQVSIIPLKGKVKLLSAPKGEVTYFFGVSSEGQQIQIRKVGSGIGGDMKYNNESLL